ncbi:CG14160 [Drosophila busckii]|uniref:CG14160 n=1 Tax=Drosophila busckii TaxID=30019 RepID=A0A0M3QWK2_DROBS|nr:uncharacterized protein LOC108598759 [Drosophila busckii]ALC44293.1 CG14160 [Drosophila busckii]
MPMLPTIEEESKLSWLRLIWRYRQQFQAMSAASAVFVASGMRLAWSIFDTPAGKLLNDYSTHNLMVSWFFGVAFGALLAAFFVQHVSKNIAYTSSGLLLLAAGIMSLTLPRHFNAACYSSFSVGAAYGLTQLQAAVTGGEVAHKSIRGMLLSCERVFLWLGVCVQLFYTRLWYKLEPLERGHSMHIDQMHGLILGCLGLAAVVLSLGHRLESPLLLLRQDRDMVDTLKQLHGNSQSGTELLRLREDCRQLHNARNWELFAQQASPESGCQRFLRRLVPLFKLLLLRGFVALAMSLEFNRAFLLVSWHGLECDMNCLYWLACCGFVGSVGGALLVDWQGRRKLCSLSLFVAGILIVMIGGVFEHLESAKKTYDDINLQAIALLMLLFELIVAGGVAVPAFVYTGEAFGVTDKARYFAVILICEQLLQSGLIAAAFLHSLRDSVFFFTLGGLSFAFGLLVFMLMPETRHLTLYECLLKFNKVP